MEDITVSGAEKTLNYGSRCRTDEDDGINVGLLSEKVMDVPQEEAAGAPKEAVIIRGTLRFQWHDGL